MRIHECYRLSEDLPAIIFDENTARDIKRNLSCFIGDEICMQIIQDNKAGIVSGQLRGFNEVVKGYKVPVLVATISSTLPHGSVSHHNHVLGARGDYARVARVVSKRHVGGIHREYLKGGESCIRTIGRQILFENIDALEEWYELFKKKKGGFREEEYKLAVERFGLSESNWKPFYDKQ